MKKKLSLLEVELGEDTVERIHRDSKSLTECLIAFQKAYNDRPDWNSVVSPTCAGCCCVPGKFLPD